MSSLDLTALRVIAAKDVEQAIGRGVKEIVTRREAVITPLALDALQRRSIVVRQDGVAAVCTTPAATTPARGPSGKTEWERLFHSPEAQRAKAEIIAVGKKLWHRHYVDGNGGNISYRIGPNAVLCTPTLCSKYDLTPDMICMVDLEGNQLAGTATRTSEIFLHLEIFKAVPEAKGVVHCHPPYATAYAITGRVPPSGIVPEFDVFVGAVAYAPYETPGTQAFAETVVPFVKNYNTILLGNHGIVCWADTVTHAEWAVEVLETYCLTLTIAQNHLGVPVSKIPAAKAKDLLSIKKRLGLPDPRFTPDVCPLAEADDADGIALMPPKPCTCAATGIRTCPVGTPPSGPGAGGLDVESIVRDVTAAVMAAIDARLGKS